MGLTFKDIKLSIPTEIAHFQGIMDIWTTIIVLVWLKKKVPEKKGEWVMIGMKSESYLKKEKVEFSKYIT